MYNIRRNIQKMLCKILGYKIMTYLYYFIVYRSFLKLNNPVNFSEKIQWLKLYYFPITPLVIECTDKIKVKSYVKSKGLSNILNEEYARWYDEKEINFENIPNEFALKFNHGCGYNVIVDDFKSIEKDNFRKKINKWWKDDFSLYNAEKHYKYIKPAIIIEKNLGQNLLDYKFFCFNGVPKFFYVAKGFATKNDNQRMSFYNMDGSKTSFNRLDYKELKDDDVSFNLVDQMTQYSKILSEDFHFVRVDFFVTNDAIVFSELTFTPGGGFMSLNPKSSDNLIGKMLNIGDLIEGRNI